MATDQTPKPKSRAEKLFANYHERLLDIQSSDISELSMVELEEWCNGIEQEMNTLESKKSAILSKSIRASLKDRYVLHLNRFREIVDMVRSFNESLASLTKEISAALKVNSSDLKTQLSEFCGIFEKLNSNQLISESQKQNITNQYNAQIQFITKCFLYGELPAQFRDSIDLIEKTLAEPELYSLPSLIMWRETAEEKIGKMMLIQKIFPQEIVKNIVQIYESLIKQLRAEILKLRTYPIPEPWCSEVMREGLTHVIKGEFIFFVHPRLMEEMKPLDQFEIEPLPGGLTRQKYDSRLTRLYNEFTQIYEQLEDRNVRGIEMKLHKLIALYESIKERVTNTFREFPLLYRDRRTLEYLVDKNDDDELLKDIYKIIRRIIRHHRDNRIDIPSFAIDSKDEPMTVAPPKQERNIPIASGIDKGALETLQLNTPSSVIVIENTVITADRYSHYVSWYRAKDLASYGGFLSLPDDTPLSLTIFKELLYVCYYNKFMQCSLSWKDDVEISYINRKTTIPIEQCCCTTSNDDSLFVGTLKPSLILMNTDTLRVEQEYQLNPIRYHTRNKKNRYPWLQDIKTARIYMFCLFTGSPSPLQMFSLTGELITPILTEDKIVGAYNFNLYVHPLKSELSIYISDFWGNDIKVFDSNGKFIETFCEKGIELCQLIRPTAIFIEHSGYITICDMKDDNCLQRL